jgi:hypothetical protein
MNISNVTTCFSQDFSARKNLVMMQYSNTVSSQQAHHGAAVRVQCRKRCGACVFPAGPIVYKERVQKLIVSRLAGALRRQHWFGVFVELFIVVAGILIALQVDNWNEQRKQADEARAWRTQIIEELQGTRDDLSGRRDYYAKELEFAETALAGLESDAAVTAEQAWEIVLAAYQASQVWPYRLTGPTYREAQNAGGLALVGDTDTLRALADFYDVSAYDFDLVTASLPRYRELVRERTPWPIQNHIWTQDCERKRPGAIHDVFELMHCAAPEDDDLLQQTVAAFRADKDLQQALLGRMAQLKITVSSSNNRLSVLQRLLDRLEGSATQ